MSRVKKFGKKYWLPITVGVVCITVTYIVTRRVTLRGLPIKGFKEVWIPHHPGDGNPVWNLKDTNIVFRSQEQASYAWDIPRDILSQHLTGQLPNAYGEAFERVELRTFAKPLKR